MEHPIEFTLSKAAPTTGPIRVPSGAVGVKVEGKCPAFWADILLSDGLKSQVKIEYFCKDPNQKAIKREVHFSNYPFSVHYLELRSITLEEVNGEDVIAGTILFV